MFLKYDFTSHKKKFDFTMLRPQHFHNIFTINHKRLVGIGSNLNLSLKLLFYPTNNNPKQLVKLPHKICCENIMDITFLLTEIKNIISIQHEN